jgi:hypothetical protein
MVYPNDPGYQKTDTSYGAAILMRRRASVIRDLVLQALESAPLATFEIAKRIPQFSYRAIQPRTSELRQAGKIKDSGLRKVDPETGKRVIVWETCHAHS